MSSPLDARIRNLAREEAAALLAEAPSARGGSDRVAELEQQVSTLTARVEELEKASAPAPAAKRTARKTPETSE
jgi:hypothetical protein